MNTAGVSIEIDGHDIADSISELPYDDILEIYKRVDANIADWDFTKSVFEYYQKEIKLLNSDESY